MSRTPLSPVRLFLLAAVLFHFLLASVCTNKTLAQEYPIRTFGEGQLPKVGEAKGMLQDKRGVLWMWGTRGISWYDGTRFGHFSVRNGLPSDYVYTIIQAPDSTMYFSTYGGLVHFDPADSRMETVLALPGSPIRDIALHDRGLFIATDGGVLFHDERGFFLLAVMGENSDDAANYMAQRIVYDSTNHLLWAATDRFGVARIEVDKLWPLLELKQPVWSPNQQHICPVAFGWEGRMVKDKLDGYVLDNPGERLVAWKAASSFVGGSPDNNLLPTYGVVLDKETHEPVVWDREYVYRIREGRMFHPIRLPNDSALLRTVSVAYDDRLSVSRGNRVYWIDGMEAVEIEYGERLLTREIAVHFHDLQGFHWMIDSQGDLHRFASKHIQVYHSARHPMLQNLQHIKVQDNGDLLLASSHGISRLHGNEIKTLYRFGDLPGDYVNFGVDRLGRFLIATSTRLSLHDPQNGKTRPLTPMLPVNTSRTNVDRDSDGNLWLILSGHLYRWDGKTLVHHEGATYIGSLFMDIEDDGGIFIGQWPWLLEHRYGKKRYYAEHDVGEDAPDRVPSNIVGKNIIMLDLPTNLLTDDFAAMEGARGPDGAYWVGTFNAGIVRIVSSQDARETVQSLKVFDRRTGLPSNSVSGLNRDNEGNLLFTLTNGAAIVRESGLEVLDLDLPEGAVLLDVLIDSRDRLICATTQGLFVQDGSLRYNFDRSSGLPEDLVVRLQILKDGRLLAQQPNGFYLLDLEEVLTNLVSGSPPIVSSITLDGYNLGSASHVEIRSPRRTLSCDLALPDFFNEDSHLFSWRLRGFEQEFRPFSRLTHIEYTNLPPGVHELEVRARNGLGEERSLTTPLMVYVPKHYYETYTFFILVGLTLFGIGLLLFRWRLSVLRADKDRELTLQREKLLVANRLAASIAHEFNNPLQIILGSYELVRQKAVEPARREEYLDRIPRQVSRMQKLIEKLLRIREVREVDYAAGVKILDIHPVNTNVGKRDSDSTTDPDVPH